MGINVESKYNSEHWFKTISFVFNLNLTHNLRVLCLFCVSLTAVLSLQLLRGRGVTIHRPKTKQKWLHLDQPNHRFQYHSQQFPWHELYLILEVHSWRYYLISLSTIGSVEYSTQESYLLTPNSYLAWRFLLGSCSTDPGRLFHLLPRKFSHLLPHLLPRKIEAFTVLEWPYGIEAIPSLRMYRLSS